MNKTDVGIDESPSSGSSPMATSPSGAIKGTSRGARHSTSSPESVLTQDLDRVSLVQALIDTEAATARVIDLTERLVDSRLQINQLRGELETLRIEHHQFRAQHEAMKSSSAFRLASLIWSIRNALRI